MSSQPGQTAAVLPYAAPKTPQPAAGVESRGAWSPLRIAIFRSLWIANLVSLIGTWAQEAGGPWLMGQLTSDKRLIAAVTSVGSLAICLLSLPAGVLADILDRRRLLIFTQLWMLLAAATLGILYYAHLITPPVLLGFTFFLYVGAALAGPAFQYVVPELVPPEEMALAIGLNSVALNLARAVGPALGMAIVTFGGAGACFFFNGLTFLGVAWVLYGWDRRPPVRKTKPERFAEGMRTGFRYTWHSPALRAILIRVFAFIVCASALWGLLVPLAKGVLGRGEVGFGIMMACLGVGAVGGVFAMPHLQRKLNTDGMVAACTAMFALGLFGVSQSNVFWITCVLMVFLGANWVIVPTSFNVATQRSVPAWVKGRAISMYMTVLFGSLATAGFWGWVAQRTSVQHALLVASIAQAAGLALVIPFPLTRNAKVDFKPSKHWPKPEVARELGGEEGPVMVTIEYQVEPAQAAAFSEAMHQVRAQRLRDGAYHWGLFDSAAAPGRWMEMFLVHSWSEHLRQHERMTQSDRMIEERARAFHTGSEPPRMAHWVHGARNNARAAGPAAARNGQAEQKWQAALRERMGRESALFAERYRRGMDVRPWALRRRRWG